MMSDFFINIYIYIKYFFHFFLKKKIFCTILDLDIYIQQCTLCLIFIGMHSDIHILMVSRGLLKVSRKCGYKHDSDSTENYSE